MTAPIKGYNNKPSQEQLDLVNENKMLEELTLRQIERITDMMGAGDAVKPDLDTYRWLAIARTSIQDGNMALNRAIMQPQRLDDHALDALGLVAMLESRK